MSERKGVPIVNVLIGLVIAGAIGAAVWAVLHGEHTGEEHRGVGRDLLYNQSEIRKVDPSLIRYRQVGRVPTLFKAARGLAVGPNDRIYVAGDAGVRVFESDGKRVAEFETGGEPGCLAVAADGTVFVGLVDHIEVYDAAGKRSAAWPSPGPETLLRSVAVQDDRVFAADAGNRVVLCYDRAGSLVRRIGKRNVPPGASTGDEDEGFFLRSNEHFDLAAGPDPGAPGLWVANAGRFRLERWTGDGELKWWWGTGSTKVQDFFGCCNPAHFALLPGGGFVTSEKGLLRVKTYSPEGVFDAVVAPPTDFNEEAGSLDVAADSRGRVLVLDPSAGEVRFYERISEPERKE
jgi:hypothetical protein